MPRKSSQKLGIPQLSKRQIVLEISKRIRCARLWCHNYWGVLCNPDLQRRVKFQLYKFFVRPIFTYGCELWVLDKQNARKLLHFEWSVLIEIYKSKYPHRHPKRLRLNKMLVYHQYREPDVVNHIFKERLRWIDLLEIENQALKRIRVQKREQYRVRWWDQ